MNALNEIPMPPPFPSGEPRFLDDLRTCDPRRPHWKNAPAPAGTLDLRGTWAVERNFPDPDGVLDSAYDALERFRSAYLAGGAGTVHLTAGVDAKLDCEAYTIRIDADGINLAAADTEGLRRALYHLIDLMRGAEVPALAPRTIARKPWLKNRISRCFFGPIKRPPFNRDELTDDIDYYPEPYLDRLASEGVNGIWLTVVWKEVGATSVFPVDPLREKRLAKLRRTVEKCRRYGIKVWIFCIEPASWRPENPLPEGCGAMQGDVGMGEYQAFCVGSEMSQRHIRETSASIFREVPHLGGMMLISLGERPTSCLSYIYSSESGELACRNRCKLSNSQILDKALSAIREGIRDAGSDAEVLSWLYNPHPEQIPEWWFDLPTELGRDKILAFNFESGCTKLQTGRAHAGGDYWLSCTGPSDRFGRMAAAAHGHCAFAAKLQVGCSHELATVPFMPVPGILYRKYRAMKHLGVEHVLQCWYFGNYPGLMNRAAGRLAFEEFDTGEAAFLEELARPEWGGAHAREVADMWHRFGEAYANYPLDIQFQYYGPMHDGVVWPLRLKPSMKSLTRSWKPEDFPAGDAVGECLGNHDFADVVMLTGLLAKGWDAAAGVIPELRRIFAEDPARQRDCDLYEALKLLFDSGSRILSFYSLRKTLFTSPRGCHATLEAMRKLARMEKAASERMIELCENDPRLGYHSEAEVFKFHPAKLRWRIAELEKLDADFDELAAKTPEEIKTLFAWSGATFRTGEVYQAKTFSWRAELVEDDLVFTIRLRPLDSSCGGEIRQLFLMDEAAVRPPLVLTFQPGGDIATHYKRGQGISALEEGDTLRVTVPLAKLDHARRVFAGVQRTWLDAARKLQSDNLPEGVYNTDPRLNMNGFSPERLGLMEL